MVHPFCAHDKHKNENVEEEKAASSHSNSPDSSHPLVLNGLHGGDNLSSNNKSVSVGTSSVV